MRSLARFMALVLGVALLGYLVWVWGFCRFYVEPGYMAIVTAKTGKALEPNQILAKAGQKGIQEDVLGEGRHFLDPIFYEREIRPLITIPPGKVGMVTSKVGKKLPEGEFLADAGEKGIWRRVLGPGKYRLNPYGYQVDISTAISIPIGYAGVVTSLSGQQAEEGEFAKANEKGVRRDVLQPGLYYVNPMEYKVDVLEIGVNQVSLLGKLGGAVITKTKIATQNAAMEELQTEVLQQQREKRFDYLKKSADLFTTRSQQQPRPQQPRGTYQPDTANQREQADMERMKQQYLLGDSMATMGLAQFVEFPSRDGFEISLDMTVEFELEPDRIAWIFRSYGDLPAVVDKVIMPQISSISRNKGSEYRAKDFIVGEGREKFQNDLTQALARTLGTKEIIVHNALIRHVVVPMQILDPIQQASKAVEQDLTNKELQNTAKREADLNTEQSMIDQRRQQVLEETEKLKAEIRADQDKQVATIRAEARRMVAEIEKDTAAIKADTVRIMSKAEADATRLVEGEAAAGLQLKARAFGDSQGYALLEFASQLNPKTRINILHAGDGTLWTDLDSAGMAPLGGAAVLRGQTKQK
ncbi:MAG: SPFH domain-containing protein [Verrucomicrobia bacterium]|nr:SPFH domain-containing protein [Verrucomicrobiota bacterium]